MTTATKTGIPEKEFLKMLRDNNWLEVVNGEVVESMSTANISHAFIIANVDDVLKTYVKQNDLGYVLGDGLHYKLDETAQGLKGTRLPDVSFIHKHRVTPELDPTGLFPGAPDLAVEVVSPSEGEEVTLAKVRDYLRYGTEQVWVLYPDVQEVHVYTAADPKTIRVYMNDDTLTAESLFPGLEIKVSQFFVLPFVGADRE